MSEENVKRRDFLKVTTAAAIMGVALPSSRVLGANERVRIGIIGPGARGQELMKEALKLPNIEFVAASDVYTRRRDQAKAMLPASAKIYADHRQLLDSKDIDAVLVASPLHCHARHFLDTLAAGKDLYSEKTMTYSIEEAETCRAAALKSKQVVTIGLQHQSTGALIDAKQWIKDGLLGKVTHIESWMSRNSPRGKGQWVRPVPADCTAANVNWKAFLNGREDRPFDPHQFINWRLFWDYSGGNVTENMVHQIAWVMRALDLPVPVAAYMSGGVFSEKDGREVPDTIAVTLDFPGDLVLTWQSTFSNERYGWGDRILGSDGTIERVAGSTDMVTGKSQTGTRYNPENINRPQGAAQVSETKDQNHMADFIDAVKTRRAPNAPVEIGYRSAVAAHLANLSYRRKQRVTLDSITETSRK